MVNYGQSNNIFSNMDINRKCGWRVIAAYRRDEWRVIAADRRDEWRVIYSFLNV